MALAGLTPPPPPPPVDSPPSVNITSPLNGDTVSGSVTIEASASDDEGISYVSQRKVGEFLHKKVFEPGSVYHWDDMIERATGEPLTPKYFVAEFVK